MGGVNTLNMKLDVDRKGQDNTDLRPLAGHYSLLKYEPFVPSESHWSPNHQQENTSSLNRFNPIHRAYINQKVNTRLYFFISSLCFSTEMILLFFVIDRRMMTQKTFKKISGSRCSVALLLFLLSVAAVANADVNFKTEGDVASAGGCGWDSLVDGNYIDLNYLFVSSNDEGTNDPNEAFSLDQCIAGCTGNCTHWTYAVGHSNSKLSYPPWHCITFVAPNYHLSAKAMPNYSYDLSKSACGFVPSRATSQAAAI